MKFLFLGGLTLGAIAVFQPLLNKTIAEHKGLAVAIWINGLVLFIGASFLLLFVAFNAAQSPNIFIVRPLGAWSFWYFLPGTMGLALVTGLPVMMKNYGAFLTVMAFLTGQLFISFFWDLWSQSHSFSAARFFGLVLALLGTYFSIRPTT